MSKKFNNLFDQEISFDRDAIAENFITSLPTSRGVILFIDMAGNPFLLLQTANIRRGVKSRLLVGSEDYSKKTDISKITSSVLYKETFSPLRTELCQLKLAKQIFCSNWADHYALPETCFVVIDPGEKWPEFSIKNRVEAGCLCFGPFSFRKQAHELVKAVNDGFSLCRRRDIVDDPEKAKNCPYLQMETCPAPCVGGISREDYQQKINEAIDTVGRERDIVADLEIKMKLASVDMDFELAGQIKKQIDSLSVTSKGAYRHTHEVSNTRLLHFDKSAKVKVEGSRRKEESYSFHLFTSGDIVDLGDFVESDFDKLVEIVNVKSEVDESVLLSGTDIFSFLCQFLYSSNWKGKWVDLSRSDLSVDDIVIEK